MKEQEKNINNGLFKEYFTNYQNLSDIYKKLLVAEGEWNKERVFLIKKMLNKKKNVIENMPEDRKFKTEKNEKIINIVERILYFNQLEQSGKDLKILTPNQMLSALPISLVQLKARNNS